MLRIDLLPLLCYNTPKAVMIMIKLYFKKILFTLGFITNYFLLVAILAFTSHLIFRDAFSELVNTIIHAILALVLNFVIVCVIRYKSLHYNTDRLNNFSFFSIIKSRDNIVHTLAFISILLPFFVSIAIVENTPLLPLVIGTIILLFACGLIFITVNTLMWSIICKIFKRKNISET